MALDSFIIGLGGVLTVIGLAVLYKYSGLSEILKPILDGLFKSIDWLLQSNDKIKILFWFLFIIVIGGGALNFLIGLHFFCTTDDTVRTTSVAIVDGIGLSIQTLLFNLAAEDESVDYNLTYDEFLYNRTSVYNVANESSYEGTFNIKCEDKSPRIRVYGLDIFDYKIWVLLFILFGLCFIIFRIS
jgi:hypothetical protein